MSDAAPDMLPNGTLCPQCGYDMGGLRHGQCPECGSVPMIQERYTPDEFQEFARQSEVRFSAVKWIGLVWAGVVIFLSVVIGGFIGVVIGIGSVTITLAGIHFGANGGGLLPILDARVHSMIWKRSLWILLLPYSFPMTLGIMGVAAGGLEGAVTSALLGTLLGGLASFVTFLSFMKSTNRDSSKYFGPDKSWLPGNEISLWCAVIVGLAMPLALAVLVTSRAGM